MAANGTATPATEAVSLHQPVSVHQWSSIKTN